MRKRRSPPSRYVVEVGDDRSVDIYVDGRLSVSGIGLEEVPAVMRRQYPMASEMEVRSPDGSVSLSRLRVRKKLRGRT